MQPVWHVRGSMSTRCNQTKGGIEMSGNSADIVNIVISGVGGQGVLTLAEIMAKAALVDGLNVRVGEIHGMAQRGGHVICTVRIGSDVRGPIVDTGTADILVGFEPAETLREVSLIKPEGYILMNTHVVYPVAVSMGKAEYPSEDTIDSSLREFTENIIKFDAMQFAKDAGSSRSMNMVMMGAVIGSSLTPISEDSALQTIVSAFPGKFESINKSAFRRGLEEVRNHI
ncbi:indolepyruvate ferredoxin oxidoreductase subunit beta [Candidatus Thorarchaeota archaeon]|nr:MAG: indolepyruvate ferredoxin oxidoreductase subunit beta [Candidatus Thorarchaeota archaeon]